MASDQHDRHAEAGAGGERVSYPTNHVVGVIDTQQALERTVQALHGVGFADAEVEIACGQSAADAMRAQTGRTGLANLAIRVAEKIGAANDEMRVKDHYERALRDGRFLLLVDTPTDAKKDRAAEVLREQGAHSVNYMGRFAREEIVPPPDRG